MGVSLFYFLALIPTGIGGYLWYRNHEVVWQEWLGGAAAALLTAALFHVLAVSGMTSDIETWSGQIEKATHHPRWVERYTVTHHHSSGTGKNKRTWTTTETKYRTHPEHWTAETTLGTEHEITEEFYREIKSQFGGVATTEQPHKSGFSSGDRNTYVVYNATGYVHPTTTLRHWENRIKAAPSLFSFAKVPTNVVVHPWPRNPDWRESDRLLGTAELFYDRREFDLMNSRLGPAKHVNVIMVGFLDADPKIAHWQEAAWVGGKKNDLVLCFGRATREKPAQWSYVFGWSESELCKRNLETLLIKEPPSLALLARLEHEIVYNYVAKDWSKFDYITVEPPGWTYWVFFLVMAGSQSGLYVLFHRNDVFKRTPHFRPRFR